MKNEVKIISPIDGTFVSIDEWKKAENPESAELVAVPLENGDTLIIRKAPTIDLYEFKEAQAIANQYKPEKSQYTGFRCPTRKECIDLYDARFKSRLDEALALVGGHLDVDFWTCETDADPRYGASGAWCFYGSIGYLHVNVFCSSLRALPVLLLKTSDASL